ncbi:hypothetical protein C0Q70_13034 [Pomacea canaliculata]|uniref:Uncharacterized protein n=1 Tax=Pomacea canaliculata TaxID=400727 RepID=A0A2T7P376_POMCA|nr:hypothetical protein C0Q70_13034 [Pomacea canaliculata]
MLRKRGLSGISCVDYNNKTKMRIHYNCTIRVRAFQILDCDPNHPLELERSVVAHEATCIGIPRKNDVTWYLKWSEPYMMDFAEVGYCSRVCHSDWEFVSIQRPTKTTSVIRIKGRVRNLGLSVVPKLEGEGIDEEGTTSPDDLFKKRAAKIQEKGIDEEGTISPDDLIKKGAPELEEEGADEGGTTSTDDLLKKAIKIEGCGSDQHLVVEQAQRSFVLTCKEITAGYHVTWFFRKHHKTWSDFISAAVCYTYNVHCYRWLQTLTAHRINDSVIELRVQDVFHERPSLIQDSSITCREFDDNNNFMHDYTCNLHVIRK